MFSCFIDASIYIYIMYIVILYGGKWQYVFKFLNAFVLWPSYLISRELSYRCCYTYTKGDNPKDTVKLYYSE